MNDENFKNTFCSLNHALNHVLTVVCSVTKSAYLGDQSPKAPIWQAL